MRYLFLLSVRFYQRIISPLLPPRCRFYPSCSSYAYTVIHEQGASKGLLLTGKRLLKCHPFHPGGIDFPPVICDKGHP